MTYPNSGNANVTPSPAIHTFPATTGGANPGLAIAKQLEASAEFIIEGFIGQVLIAFGGIEIAGIKPFAALAAIGQALIAQAQAAYDGQATANDKADGAASILGLGSGNDLLGSLDLSTIWANIISGKINPLSLLTGGGILQPLIDGLLHGGSGGGAGTGLTSLLSSFTGLLPSILDHGDGSTSIFSGSGLTANSDGTLHLPAQLGGATSLLTLIENADGSVMSIAEVLQNLGGLVGTHHAVATHQQATTDTIVQTLTGTTNTGFQVSDIAQVLQLIPGANVLGHGGPSNITDTVQAGWDALGQGMTGGTGSGFSLGNIASAAAALLGMANGAQTVAQSASARFTNAAVAKPTYHALDPTADAVFDLAQISGSTPTFVPVTASASVMGLIGTPHGGLKQTVIWHGQDTTSVTGLYITVYKVDTTTGAATQLSHSANLIGAVSNGLSENYYNLVGVDQFLSAQGDWYVAEMQITGSGTYHVVGMPNHWLAPSATVIPKGLGATRATSGSTAPSTISSLTYSNNIPWFAIGGTAGASGHPPETIEFSSAGSFAYDVPGWLEAGDLIDLVALGGGAGGQAGGTLGVGKGGYGGTYAHVTLTYGTDITLGTTTISGTVGAGGAEGSGIQYTQGHPGGDTSVTVPGYGTLTASGGTTLSGSLTGASPGNDTLDGVIYYGGAAETTASNDGNSPGGGGAGGPTVLYFGLPGGAGAAGAVWFRARQG